MTRLVAEVVHKHVATSPMRTARVQGMLAKAGFAPLTKEEVSRRQFGDSTADALQRFQTSEGLVVDGLAGDKTLSRLRERALDATLSSGRQTAILQRRLLRAARTRGLEIHIDGAEMKDRRIGPSTEAAVQALQESVGLPSTGKVDVETYERVSALAASRRGPSPKVQVPDSAMLQKVPRQLRLNMVNKHVPALQRALAFLGHPPAEKELKAAQFGPSTRKAVLAFQTRTGLPRTGEADKKTLRSLNLAVGQATPGPVHACRIRGCVRDESWVGRGDITVEVSTNPLMGDGIVIATRHTLANGFYDMPYDVPENRGNGQPMTPLTLRVLFRDTNGKVIGTKELQGPPLIAWVNFTQGPYPYKGPSIYEAHRAAITAAGVPRVQDLVETQERPEVTRLAQIAGLSQDDLMRLILAEKASTQLQGQLNAEVCFAFLAQSLPSNTPDDLLAQTHEWTLIDQLTDLVASGIAFTDPDLARSTIATALTQNLVPITLAARRDAVLAELAAVRRRFALDRPLLVGNGTLRRTLERSAVPGASYDAVADVFVRTGGMGPNFWKDLRTTPGLYGGEPAVTSLETHVDLRMVTKNFEPMVELLQTRIDEPNVDEPNQPKISSTRDLAKLSDNQWLQLIADVGNVVPANTDGQEPEDQRATYAATMTAQSQRLFPTVAVTATAQRSGDTGLTRIDQIMQIVDAHPDLEFRVSNIDTFLAAKNLDVDQETHTELRVMQRVNRMAPTAGAAVALLENGLHSATQIVALGQGELVRRLEASGVEAAAAASIHGYAEFQYAQVLQRIGEFRSELQSATPAALLPQLITAEQRAELLNAIPDLEMLFGPMDVCDCPHCASVYGPAAYLADVLRFLDAHQAATGGRTVRQVLAERRPEVGRVKLDCSNTETPLPYIDLVNEILEAAFPGSDGKTDLQTTRPADELRATPEHVDETVYDLLRVSDMPLTSSFDLWQEQTRVLLDHLGVPRWKLQESFRPPGAQIAETADTAAEFFGICSHEAGLVMHARTAVAEQNKLWGFDASRTEIPVLEVLDRSGLSYHELLLLLQSPWLTPTEAQRLKIERPGDSADLSLQRLVGVTPTVLDKMHRLLRLRRHTPWDVWELDMLIRADRIGHGDLDGATLSALHAAALVGERLQLRAEQLATWFGLLPMQGHPNASDPTDVSAAAPSLYAATFLSRAVADPPEPAFQPQPDGSDLSQHRPALLAALAVSDSALTALLRRRTGGPVVNTLPTLSALVGWSELARGLRIDLSELLVLADLLYPLVEDPFASPRDMLDFLDLFDELQHTGMSITEQDFILGARPDSPLAPTDKAIELGLETVRESVRTNPAASLDGQVIASFSAAARLTPAHARELLEQADSTGILKAPFNDPEFVAQNSKGEYDYEVTAARFPRLFEVYRRFLKMARVVESAGLDAENLTLFLANQNLIGLKLADLPVAEAPPSPLTAGWVAMLRWSRSRRSIGVLSAAISSAPGQAPTTPRHSPDDLMRLASTPEVDVATVRALAADLTGLDVDTLGVLDGKVATAYTDPNFLLRLVDCASCAHRLGVSGAIAMKWAAREHTDGLTEREVAAQVRTAAKAKYDRTAWLSVLTPLEDTWRERKRDALVAYLIEHSVRNEPETITIAGKLWPNPRYWNRPEDLLRYFLVDVEMSSCQLTSRIKQLIGTAQMFVQRAFLNREQPHVVVSSDEKGDLTSPDSWRQWKWMKSYRLWEANRKIFLYPENWIEPELRDDKTPFFVELEQEVLQSDITSENCETALRNYLQKLQEVANLEIVGVHHEIEDDHPWDNLPPTVNIMHVVGRTRGEPFTYFYRRFDLTRGLWSAWEKIDVDVTGDQVLPVVYNRVLHLFWLQVAEKAQKNNRQPAAQGTPGPQSAPETPTQMELKLAWTVRQGTGWSARQVSPHTLVHPWRRPERSYTIKPRYHNAENQLWLDVYISMTVEFNNQLFWDPYSGRPNFRTGRRFDETARPWHSSSFVFDGHVTDLRMKPLTGQYHLPDAEGQAQLVDTDSYHYVRALSDPQGRVLKTLAGTKEISARVTLPDGMHLESGRLHNNTWMPNTGNLNVLQGGMTVNLLKAARAPFRLVYSLHRIQFDTVSERSPFFYTDAARSYFVTSQWANVTIDSSTTVQRLQYTFLPFHHPYAALFVRELNRSGVQGLLTRTLQRFPGSYPPANNFSFASYAPVDGVAAADPTAQHDVLDFSRSGAMSAYNWEVFFHIPFLIACKLSTNQRFEEALDWIHRVFDPTNTEALAAPQRFWVAKPFFDQNDDEYRRQRIQSILADANLDTSKAEIREWRNHPFVPDAIARFRPVAYQKAVVMKYIDILVAWGDQLFRRDTLESINEATLLYVLAAELLGRRPEHVPMVPRDSKSFDELTADRALDPFGNKNIEANLENFTQRPTMVIATDTPGVLPMVNLSYFGIPSNTDLLAYWDTVEDRLFKIRHCMNLAGVARQLPLFEPPIDPAVLVRAVAAGVDLDSVLGDTGAGGSPYRYATLFASAMSCALDVRALGDRVLSALERRDAEALERLRAANDSGLQPLITQVREAQLTEAIRNREAVEQGRDVVQARIDHYSSLPYMNTWETFATIVHGAGVVSQIVATVLNAVSGGASLAPTGTFGAAGFGGSPVGTVTYGGKNVSDSTAGFARLFEGVASILHSAGSMLETQGNYQRQHETNQFQAESARKELAQLEKQVIGAQAREAVAQYELTAQNKLVESARGVEEFLRTKYTNTELFDWTVAQLSTVYFQAYQLAYDMARRAERAYRFEIGDQTSPPLIRFGYWDSLKKGMLSGDRLVNDLRRLEAAHLERNKRRLQATTHISLATLMPGKLLELRTRGTTSIELAEWLFARENPGWINQRIVSLAVTAPCTTGPFVGVHAGLTLTQARVRVNAQTDGGFGDAFSGADSRFADAMCPVPSIRTSHGRNDRGTLPANSADDRYYAFEGAGLISRLTITLDPRDNAFDLSTLADFVLTLEYEGDDPGSPALVELARGAVQNALPTNGALLLSLDGAYAAEWSRLFHPDKGKEQRLDFTVTVEDLTYLYRQLAKSAHLRTLRADLILSSAHSGHFDTRINPPGVADPEQISAPRDAAFGDMHHATVTWPANTRDLLGDWQVQIKRDTDPTWRALPRDVTDHAWLLIQFGSQ
ncbi:Tc toxin subunit A-related protein [Rhodococcus koreensis]